MILVKFAGHKMPQNLQNWLEFCILGTFEFFPKSIFTFNQNRKAYKISANEIPALCAVHFWGYALKPVEKGLKNHPLSSFFPLLATITEIPYTVVVSTLYLTFSVWSSLTLMYSGLSVFRAAEVTITKIDWPKYCSKMFFLAAFSSFSRVLSWRIEIYRPSKIGL